MGIKFANNAVSVLTAGVTDTDTDFLIDPADDGKFPVIPTVGDDYFLVVLEDEENNLEIVKIIQHVAGSNVLKCGLVGNRGQEGTAPRSWDAGDVVEIRPTAGSFDALERATDYTKGLLEAENIDEAQTTLGVNRYAVAGGTADVITATFNPPFAALNNGMEARVRAGANANTGAVTFNPDGLGAKAVVKENGLALVAGDIAPNHEMVLRYSSALDKWILLNPVIIPKIQDGTFLWAGTAGGTADAITLALTPAITGYKAGQAFRFVSSAENTGPATVDINGLGTKSITKRGATALAAGDIPNGALVEIVYDGVQFQLLNTGSTPVGAIEMYGGATAPAGWLLCNGAEVDRSTYASLFAAIGTTFGAGDGSTTFNLPDFRSRSPIGVGQGAGLSNRTLGQKTGAESVALAENEMPQHRHIGAIYAETATTGHFRNGVAVNVGFGMKLLNPAEGNNRGAGWTDYAGSGAAHNNMHPVLGINFIIKY